jgi:hypothetical protein
MNSENFSARHAASVSMLAAGLIFASPSVSHAQTSSPAPQAGYQGSSSAFNEIESKYLFGFTDGADIGNQGEKAIEFETTGSFQKRGGKYSAIEQELEFEDVATQFFAYELSAHGMYHAINNVEGLDNLNSTAFSGLSAKLRYLLIERGPSSPIGVTISAEPEWSRIDGTDGTKTRDYASEFRLVADTELVPNRLYAALNLIYAPEIAKAFGDLNWERSSMGGISTALAYRITPSFTLGVEAEYDRAYDGLALQSFQGNGLFVGPTMHIQISPKMLLAAAFSTQVAGHAVGDPRALDLTDFERYRGNLKFEVEF